MIECGRIFEGQEWILADTVKQEFLCMLNPNCSIAMKNDVDKSIEQALAEMEDKTK
jgi:hypothetical protein